MQAPVDLLIRGASVVDGSGAPARRADLAVRGDRIVALGDPEALAGLRAEREIDASGLVAAPGFIDVHAHDDHALLAEPAMTPKTSQGVTTVIAGNCGVSLAPLVCDAPPPPLDLLDAGGAYRFPDFASYFEALADRPAAVNAAFLAGHSTLRVATMRDTGRAADRAEREQMQRLLAEALEAGAIGLSSGTFYPPAAAAPTAELVELARTVGRYRGLYTTHLRDEADGIRAALDEAFAIGRAASVPVVISHHKLAGARNHGRSRETLAAIEAAMREQAVGLDCYPYAASSTVLRSDRVALADRVRITWSRARPELAGLDLDEAARRMGVTRAAAVERLLPAGAIYFSMSEDAVARILAFPETMIGSDGLPHDAKPHPRLWGTFARVLGHYSRDRALFPLETAVRKMTGLPAERFGPQGRGLLRTGHYADITLFDAATVLDAATFDAPTRPATGVHTVLVNGAPVWHAGAATGARPGRILRRAGAPG